MKPRRFRGSYENGEQGSFAMTKVTLDSDLRSKLQELSEPLELCGETGQVLAHVVPVPNPTQYERTEPAISSEESQRQRSEPDFGTDEVLGHLERL